MIATVISIQQKVGVDEVSETDRYRQTLLDRGKDRDGQIDRRSKKKRRKDKWTSWKVQTIAQSVVQ